MPAYRMTLTMLSPVHVGTGEDIDPIEYVVREEGSGDARNTYLYALDLPRLLARLSDGQRAEFNEAADRGGTLYLRKFIDRMVDLTRDVRWKSVCHPDVYDLYRAGLESDRFQLLIHLMTRDAVTGQPYIPGSSVKGALRTAWVSRRAAAYAGGETLERLDERDFEPEVMGYRVRDERGRVRSEIRADPFRAVRVGDAPVGGDFTNTVEPVEIYKPGRSSGQPDPAGIQMYYDVTFSLIDEETIAAAGRLTIDDRLAATEVRDQRGWSFDHCLAHGASADDLLRACNDFYAPRLRDEAERFPRLREPGRRLLALFEKLKPGEALIRLGRFSHRECVTVTRTGGSPDQKGATRTLANGELPLGWAKIGLTPL